MELTKIKNDKIKILPVEKNLKNTIFPSNDTGQSKRLEIVQLNKPRLSVERRIETKMVCQTGSSDQERTLRTMPIAVNKIHVVAEPALKRFKKD